jgi:hypothetical protein
MMQDTRHNYLQLQPLSFMRFPQSKALGVSPWKDKALGLDLSRYQPVVDYKKLYGLVDFVILKAGEGDDWKDPCFAKHVQGFYDAGIPAFAYYYWRKSSQYVEVGANWYERVTPARDLQLQNILACIANKTIYGLFMDSEETADPVWSVTALGHQMQRLDVELQKHPLFGPRFLAKKFLFGMYTGEWHWNLAKDAYAWMQKYLLWVAKYGNYTAQKIEWGDIDAKWLPSPTLGVPTLGLKEGDTWDFWQWSGDRLSADFVYSNEFGRLTALDLNFFNGTRKQLYDAIGFVDPGGVVVPPVIVEPPVVPPVVPSDIEARLTVLTARVAELERWRKA